MTFRTFLTTLAVALVATACNTTGPAEGEPKVRATIVSAVAQLNVSIQVRLDNFGSTTSYVHQCYSVDRKVGNKWVYDPGLSSACISVPPDPVEANSSDFRAVILQQAALSENGSGTTEIRITFLAASDNTFNPQHTTSVRTAPITVSH